MDGPLSPQPGPDRFDFGNPNVRLTASAPALYMANGQFEFVHPASARKFYDHCQALGVSRNCSRVLRDGPSVDTRRNQA
jgi:hypothetical protein